MRRPLRRASTGPPSGPSEGKEERGWSLLAENLEAIDLWIHRVDLWIHRAKSAVGRREWPPRRHLKRPGRGRR